MKGNINHSLVYWCYNIAGEKWDLETMCRIAKNLGCKSIEILETDAFPTLAKHGLTCALAANGMPGAPFMRGFNNKPTAASKACWLNCRNSNASRTRRNGGKANEHPPIRHRPHGRASVHPGSGAFGRCRAAGRRAQAVVGRARYQGAWKPSQKTGPLKCTHPHQTMQSVR